MTPTERITAFVTLGKQLREMSSSEQAVLANEAGRQNPWFTPDSVDTALKAITRLLQQPDLEQWTSNYSLNGKSQKTIGVVMAGNIPLVGFHDFLCVLISGNRLKGKLSTQDSVLLLRIANALLEIEPRFSDRIQWSDRMDEIDSVIATGSDNTSRYFDYYFRHIPRIIRKNRSSCAILSGKESTDELRSLGMDVFCYYGLGCRNVSYLYVPVGFDLGLLPKAWQEHRSVMNVSRYINNHDYQKAILLVNRTPFLDAGYFLLKEDTALVSPVAVVHFAYYTDSEDLQQKLLTQADKLQCIVSNDRWFPGSVDFGEAQFPSVSDFADHVDTMQFLTNS